ncbi:hypothetical protein MATL_G00229910 [Megalops atlanticus]|uniref:Uncharacterized protein n=1 Tax=Megalops atlanticus TaxID=7932 RepID=A0A9D3PD92_MEGAT|nr:hypothetical protein MATL_G00229910 [Megalops atlanticus]
MRISGCDCCRRSERYSHNAGSLSGPTVDRSTTSGRRRPATAQAGAKREKNSEALKERLKAAEIHYDQGRILPEATPLI